ncbi:MAG: flippase-like domain-containing protein [Flavobacteriaceae bacterium]|nr:flippase-like domain-containing protein [Flavobacteriaceae bacterium]
MNKKFKKIIFTLLPILLGVFLIWYSLSKLSSQDIETIKTAFKTANYNWIALSLFCGILSHVSRAYRWHFMLEPLGYKPKFPNTIMAVLVAYIVNLAFPRAGDVARATTITKYENVPFEKAIGTIVAERVADVVMLLMVIAITLLVQFDFLMDFLTKKLPKNPLNSIAVVGVFLTVFFLFVRFIKKSENAFLVKVKTFINGLIEGVKSILTMKKKWAFVFHTFFIWIMYLLMFYFAAFSLDETAFLPLGALLTGFVVGALSIAATNGGLGTYPVGVQQVLILYGISSISALAFGWIMWTAQTLMIIVFGGLSFFLLPIYNKEK